MTDDTDFGVSSRFGGVIPTPNLDRVAANGLRYTNFNSTTLCSPTCAAKGLSAVLLNLRDRPATARSPTGSHDRWHPLLLD
jgi:hypothetical protein